MISILDNTDLDDYVNTNEMGGQDVEIHRVHQNHQFLIEPTQTVNIQEMK